MVMRNMLMQYLNKIKIMPIGLFWFSLLLWSPHPVVNKTGILLELKKKIG